MEAGPAPGSDCAYPGGWSRHTATTYVGDSSYTGDSVHLLRLPSDSWIYGASGNAVAHSYWAYDEASHTLQSAPNILMHDDTNYGPGFTVRGNVTAAKAATNGSSIDVQTLRNYDVAGNVVAQTDANNHTTQYDYDIVDQSNAYAFPEQITNAKGQVTRSQYDYGSGQPGWTVEPNGAATYFYYDSADRLSSVKRQSSAGGPTLSQTQYSYPSAQEVDTYIDQNAIGDQALHSAEVRDGLGRLILQRTFEAGSQWIDTTVDYDSLGRVSTQYNPSRPGDQQNYATSFIYDALGRVIQTNFPDGSSATDSYSGTETVHTDEAGKVSEVAYDGLGRMFRSRRGTGASTLEADYMHNELDHLTGVTIAGQTRSFTYDGLARLRQATNPESGTVTYGYDNVGNLTSKTDARGYIVNYGYDELDRLLSKSSPQDGSVYSTYTYDAPGLGLGRLSDESRGGVSSHFEYDARGQITLSRQTWNGTTYNFSYGYNAAGERMLPPTLPPRPSCFPL